MQIAPRRHDASNGTSQFDGCFNFRDLGGYRTRDGHVLRSRRLFRADGPHALTDADAAMLRVAERHDDPRSPHHDEATERGHYSSVLPERHHVPAADDRRAPRRRRAPVVDRSRGRRDPLPRDARQRARSDLRVARDPHRSGRLPGDAALQRGQGPHRHPERDHPRHPRCPRRDDRRRLRAERSRDGAAASSISTGPTPTPRSDSIASRRR